jgi:hypothetical protein
MDEAMASQGFESPYLHFDDISDAFISSDPTPAIKILDTDVTSFYRSKNGSSACNASKIS